MNDNGSDRLAAVEAALIAVQSAVQNVVSALGELYTGIQRQAETTANGFEALTAMIRVMNARLADLDGRLSVHVEALDARMSVLDARMVEIVHELRTHSHKAA